MFEAFGLTDPGCVRTNNEDYFISDPGLGIFILADGMGGAKAGEHASRISAEELYKHLVGNLRATLDDDPSKALETGFLQANLAVLHAAKEDPELDGMGTTLLAALAISETQLQVCSVGDSRAYLSSDGQFHTITRDQTWVAEVGSKLGLTDQALKAHPMRHVLTMAVGCGDDLRVHCHPAVLAPGDQLLLCSDGLHGVVEEEILARIVLSQKSLPDKCHYLVEAAKGKGGPDNVTVVLIQRV